MPTEDIALAAVEQEILACTQRLARLERAKVVLSNGFRSGSAVLTSVKTEAKTALSGFTPSGKKIGRPKKVPTGLEISTGAAEAAGVAGPTFSELVAKFRAKNSNSNYSPEQRAAFSLAQRKRWADRKARLAAGKK